MALSISGRSGIYSGSLDPMRTHFKSEAVSGLLRLYGLPWYAYSQTMISEVSPLPQMSVFFYHFPRVCWS